MEKKQVRKWLLPINTFVAIFIAITLSGSIVVPYLSSKLTEGYIDLQSDVNRRQAVAMAKFIQSRFNEGLSKEQVIKDIQQAITGAEADRGYICVIDQNNQQFVCHPMPQAIGMSVSAKQARYKGFTESNASQPWEDFISKKLSGSGLLLYPNNMPSEVVHMQALGSEPWTISSHENVTLMEKELDSLQKNLIIGSFLIGLLIAIPSSIGARFVGRGYERTIEEKNEALEIEQAKSHKLLLNILPKFIASKLQNKSENVQLVAEHHSNVSVLFCDLVNFTSLSSEMTPEELVQLLNDVFSRFDDLVAKYHAEKIKTIGDAYMVCAGAPTSVDNPSQTLAYIALEMFHIVKKVGKEQEKNLKIRIGIHSGEVVAGVIGKRKFAYDLWGDTVNIASRMESSGVDGKIQVSSFVYEQLKHKFLLKERGEIEVKGKGKLKTYFLMSENYSYKET